MGQTRDSYQKIKKGTVQLSRDKGGSTEKKYGGGYQTPSLKNHNSLFGPENVKKENKKIKQAKKLINPTISSLNSPWTSK